MGVFWMSQRVAPPECVVAFNAFLAEFRPHFVRCTFGGKDLPFSGLDLASKLLWNSRVDALSIWLGVHGSDSIRNQFDGLISSFKNACVRLEEVGCRMRNVNEIDLSSPRAKAITSDYVGLLEIELACLSNFLGDLTSVFNWDWEIDEPLLSDSVAQDLFSSFLGDQSDSAIDRMGTSLRKTANIPVLKQLNAHAAGNTASKQSVCLTENDRDILQAMLELNATKINPQTAEHILKTAIFTGTTRERLRG